MGIRLLQKLTIALSLGMLALGAKADSPSSPCSFQEIRDWVERHRIYNVLAPHYPPIARGLGQKGRVLANVTLDPDRRLESAFLRYPSGQKELDEGVLDMILGKSGTKLGAPSCAPEGQRFSFDIPLNFQFNDGNTVAKRELVIEYFKATNSWNALTLAAPKLTHMLFGALRQRHPDAPAETLDIITDEVRAVLKKEMGEGSPYAERLVELHQQYFTEEDIRQLITFYRSPVGRKMISATPALLAEATALGERMGEGVIQLIVDRANARLKERGHPYSISPLKPGPKANQGTGQSLRSMQL